MNIRFSLTSFQKTNNFNFLFMCLWTEQLIAHTDFKIIFQRLHFLLLLPLQMNCFVLSSIISLPAWAQKYAISWALISIRYTEYATGWTCGQPCSIFAEVTTLFFKASRPTLGGNPAPYTLVRIFIGIWRPEPQGCRAKNERNYTYTSPDAFMACIGTTLPVTFHSL
jgi:hypothetical protein